MSNITPKWETKVQRDEGSYFRSHGVSMTKTQLSRSGNLRFLGGKLERSCSDLLPTGPRHQLSRCGLGGGSRWPTGWPGTQMGAAGLWARLILRAPEWLREGYSLQGDPCGCPPPSPGNLSGGKSLGNKCQGAQPQSRWGGWWGRTKGFALSWAEGVLSPGLLATPFRLPGMNEPEACPGGLRGIWRQV